MLDLVMGLRRGQQRNDIYSVILYVPFFFRSTHGVHVATHYNVCTKCINAFAMSSGGPGKHWCPPAEPLLHPLTSHRKRRLGHMKELKSNAP